MVKKFLTLYSPETPKWDNITDLSTLFGWNGLTDQATAAYFASNGVSNRYIYEVIEAGTRVNYGQVSTSSLYSSRSLLSAFLRMLTQFMGLKALLPCPLLILLALKAVTGRSLNSSSTVLKQMSI
jgi:hypothetical protein